MLRRKRAKSEQDQARESQEGLDGPAAGADRDGEAPPGAPRDDDEAASSSRPGPVYDRSAGPFDSSEEVDLDSYADFGALLVPGVQGLNLRLEADPGTGQLIAMTMVFGGAAVQLRALAAPRTGGLWQTNRDNLLAQLNRNRGRATQAEGPFGYEIHAQVPIAAGQPGGPGKQAMRFVGVEGPRWLLHGSFMGQGADPATWDPINELFRRLVVVRGEEAMPVGSLLALRPPHSATPAPDAEPVALASMEPGARITEVR